MFIYQHVLGLYAKTQHQNQYIYSKNLIFHSIHEMYQQWVSVHNRKPQLKRLKLTVIIPLASYRWNPSLLFMIYLLFKRIADRFSFLSLSLPPLLIFEEQHGKGCSKGVKKRGQLYIEFHDKLTSLETIFFHFRRNSSTFNLKKQCVLLRKIA